MLKQLQKFFNGDASDQDKSLSQEEVDMSVEQKAALEAAENKTAELSAQLETVNATLADKENAFAELTAKFEAAQAALNASAEAQAALKAKAESDRVEARTEAVKAAIGADNVGVAALLAATDTLSDEQFNVIVAATKASFVVEAESPLFKEAGATIDEGPEDVKPAHFKNYINQGN